MAVHDRLTDLTISHRYEARHRAEYDPDGTTRMPDPTTIQRAGYTL
jgi:hypothetical protein